MSVKILQTELSEPLRPIKLSDAQGRDVWLLVRLVNEPLGWLKFDYKQLPLSIEELGDLIAKYFSWQIYQRGLGMGLKAGLAGRQGQALLDLAFEQPTPLAERTSPPLTALLLLDGTPDFKSLNISLEALRGQDYPDYKIRLVCFGPASVALQKWADDAQLPLLFGSQALGRTVEAAQADFVAITTTQGKVDRSWLRGIARAADNSTVAAVTGPHLPLELDTAAQLEFENYARRPAWFKRYYIYDQGFSVPPESLGMPLNTAFRRHFLLDHSGDALLARSFDLKALLHLYYEALRANFMIGFEPDALAWERYPREKSAARRQLRAEGQARLAYMTAASRTEWSNSRRLEMQVRTIIRSDVNLTQAARKLKSLVRR